VLPADAHAASSTNAVHVPADRLIMDSFTLVSPLSDASRPLLPGPLKLGRGSLGSRCQLMRPT
jgi:hypothetical protein